MYYFSYRRIVLLKLSKNTSTPILEIRILVANQGPGNQIIILEFILASLSRKIRCAVGWFAHRHNCATFTSTFWCGIRSELTKRKTTERILDVREVGHASIYSNRQKHIANSLRDWLVRWARREQVKVQT